MPIGVVTPARDAGKRCGKLSIYLVVAVGEANPASRKQCDRYTVCGSCIIHETICIWSKCKSLYERSGALPGGPSSDDRIARRQAEVDQLRIRIGQLADRVGLQVEDVLDPEKIRHYLVNGLPPSRPKSGCKQEGATA